jgi:hypothetical protein
MNLLKDEKIHKVANRVKFLVLIETPGSEFMMPPACPVEIHVFFWRALGLLLWMPPACPVEAHVPAKSVKLHWASQWHHSTFAPRARKKRESPLGKPVASSD